MTKEASVYGLGHGAAHHPTKAFHMLRGEAIVWLYTMALLDAIYMLEEDLKTIPASTLIEGMPYCTCVSSCIIVYLILYAVFFGSSIFRAFG